MTNITNMRFVQVDYDPPATLADLEAFCRQARQQGGSDDDVITTGPFRRRIRDLKVNIDLAHNREQAYRDDMNGPGPSSGGWRPTR